VSVRNCGGSILVYECRIEVRVRESGVARSVKKWSCKWSGGVGGKGVK